MGCLHEGNMVFIIRFYKVYWHVVIHKLDVDKYPYNLR